MSPTTSWDVEEVGVEHRRDSRHGTDTNALAAWSSPVAYGGPEFLQAFDQTVQRLEQNPDTLRAIQFALPSAEHIGFREGREWRVIHVPREWASGDELRTPLRDHVRRVECARSAIRQALIGLGVRLD